MKTLIWLGCILIPSVLINRASMGAVPVVILYAAAVGAAMALSAAWDRRRAGEASAGEADGE